MKRRKQNFLVFLAALGMVLCAGLLSLAGCKDSTDEPGPKGPTLDSALVGKWYLYPADVDDPAAEPAFEITADGRLVSEANTNGEINVTTSNGVISSRVTLNGQTAESGTAAYTVSGNRLQLSNPSGLFQSFVNLIQLAQTLGGDGYYHKGSGGSGGKGEKYTVTFDADGGTPAPQTVTVDSGGSVGSANMPSTPAKSNGDAFGGWWTARNGEGTEFTEATMVTANITVYAKWVGKTAVPGETLQAALTWLATNAVGGKAYAITVSADETIGPQSLSYSGKTVSITITGDDTEQTVSLSSSGSLFTVGSGVTLTLGENVTLQGRSANTASLVSVSSGGTLVMEDGAKITSNTAITTSSSTYYYGGGVFVASSGTFTMNGGTISGNTSSSYANAYGGGVYVYSSGTFRMNGGTISGNTTTSSSTSSSTYGGGVFVASSGTFTKGSGGVIYGANADADLQNTASSDDCGHAVYVSTEKKRNSTAGEGVTMHSGTSGAAGGWEHMVTVQIALSAPSDPSLSTTGGATSGAWTLLSDGRYRSPATADGGATKTRVSFTSTEANASISIQLDVSSEANYDYAFISTLDNASATASSGYYTGSRISGTQTATITIPVPTAGDHFIDIGYQKDGGGVSGSDCAWFKVTDSTGISTLTIPTATTTTLYVDASAQFSVSSGYASYAWYWDGELIEGATSAAYTLPANSKIPDVYELSVVVTTSTGEKLSAHRRVNIKS